MSQNTHAQNTNVFKFDVKLDIMMVKKEIGQLKSLQMIVRYLNNGANAEE